MAIRVPIQVAATLLGKSINFVRWGLQQGKLPFGYAVKNPETIRDRYSYWIDPGMLAVMTGKSLEELEALSNAYRDKVKEDRKRLEEERAAKILSMRRYKKKGRKSRKEA